MLIILQAKICFDFFLVRNPFPISVLELEHSVMVNIDINVTLVKFNTH